MFVHFNKSQQYWQYWQSVFDRNLIKCLLNTQSLKSKLPNLPNTESPAIWDDMVQKMKAQVQTDLEYTDSVEPGDLLKAVPALTWEEVRTDVTTDTFTKTTYSQKCEENKNKLQKSVTQKFVADLDVDAKMNTRFLSMGSSNPYII